MLHTNVTNPRYFVDDNGDPVFLAGSHTWINLQDISTKTAFDFDAYLDFLADHGHNYARLWNLDSSSDSGGAVSPLPFDRTGPGNAYDGGLKFDLFSLNQDFFDRLRARCIAARDRGIYVGIVLFAAFKSSPWIQSICWPYAFYNGINNINSTTTTYSDCYTLNDSTVVAAMDAFVEKVIDTVNDLDNVIYEIANEGYYTSLAWQEHVVDAIHTYEAGLDYQHLVGMTAIVTASSSDESYNDDLYASDSDWVSVCGAVTYQDDMPLAAATKPSILDDDHVTGGANPDYLWQWKAFMRGHNPAHMDFWERENSTAREQLRTALGHIRDFALRMDLLHATPTNSSGDCSTTYCLKQAGVEYMALQPGTGAFTLSIIAGTYNYEWMNAVTGIVTKGSATYSTENHTFTPPFSGPAALYLWVGTPPADSFAYYSPDVIPYTVVPNTDQADFSSRLVYSDARLKSVRYGGHVRSDRGYDICFYSDSGRTTLLNWEIEHYNPSTGDLIVHVQKTLSHTGNTTIYIACGNPYITSIQCLPSAAYDSSHKLVLNFGSSGFLRDSLGVNSLASTDSVPPVAGGSVAFNDGNGYINCGNDASLDLTGDFTISLWFKATNWTDNLLSTFISKRDTYAGLDWELFYNRANSDIEFWFGNAGAVALFDALNVNPSTGAWHHLAVTRSGNNFTLWLDGVNKGTETSSTAMPTGDSVRIGMLGNDIVGNHDYYFKGLIDKVRLSATARSADWIATEYNSRNDPSAFHSLGTEVGGITGTAESPFGFTQQATSKESFTAASASTFAYSQSVTGKESFKVTAESVFGFTQESTAKQSFSATASSLYSFTQASAASESFISTALSTFAYSQEITSKQVFTGSGQSIFSFTQSAYQESVSYAGSASSVFGFTQEIAAKEAFKTTIASDFTYTQEVTAKQAFPGQASSSFAFIQAANGKEAFASVGSSSFLFSQAIAGSVAAPGTYTGTALSVFDFSQQLTGTYTPLALTGIASSTFAFSQSSTGLEVFGGQAQSDFSFVHESIGKQAFIGSLLSGFGFSQEITCSQRFLCIGQSDFYFECAGNVVPYLASVSETIAVESEPYVIFVEAEDYTVEL